MAGIATVVPQDPGALALAPNGGQYIADDKRDQVLERLPSGRFVVVAGTGKHGFAGDGGPAAAAELNNPGGIVVGSDGSVYVADVNNNRVRRIFPDGKIATVAGNGGDGWTRSGAKATAAPVSSPTAVAFGPDGRLYITASGELLRLERNDTLTRVAGVRRYQGIYGVGRSATDASTDGANGLAFDKAGDLYLSGFSTKTLLMIDKSGHMRLPIGMTGFYPRSTGGLTRTPGGNVLAVETQRLVELSPHGLNVVADFSHRMVGGIIGFLPAGIAATGTGVIYTDTGYGNGWSSGSALIALTPTGHIQLLWSHPR